MRICPDLARKKTYFGEDRPLIFQVFRPFILSFTHPLKRLEGSGNYTGRVSVVTFEKSRVSGWIVENAHHE
jgi:hypothetical protein